MMTQRFLDLSALDAHPCFSHHFCFLSYPYYDDELHASRLGVVGVLNTDVGVLGFGGEKVGFKSVRMC